MLDSGLQQICNKNQTRVVDEDIAAAKQRQGLIGELARRSHGAQISRHDITQPTQLAVQAPVACAPDRSDPGH
jgi:hypothetical protein